VRLIVSARGRINPPDKIIKEFKHQVELVLPKAEIPDVTSKKANYFQAFGVFEI
jgi:hypothetical protein